MMTKSEAIDFLEQAIEQVTDKAMHQPFRNQDEYNGTILPILKAIENAYNTGYQTAIDETKSFLTTKQGEGVEVNWTGITD